MKNDKNKIAESKKKIIKLGFSLESSSLNIIKNIIYFWGVGISNTHKKLSALSDYKRRWRSGLGNEFLGNEMEKFLVVYLVYKLCILSY